MNHGGFLPEFVNVTEGSKHEVNISRLFNFPKGGIVVFDKGYTDYHWFNQLTHKGIFFVTHLKSNTIKLMEQQ